LLVVNQLEKTIITPDVDLHILKNINFSLDAGQSMAITGVSGSGKSTLLAILAGLDSATSGQVSIAGQSLTDLNEEERAQLRQYKIGFVFQSFHLIPTLTALDNVMLALVLKGESEAKMQAKQLLKRVGLGQRYDHTPEQLSGGEQQRVAIARAFAGQPAILFADEPTGNLDQESSDNIIQLLFELNQQEQTTLVLVTHDQLLANKCQRHFYLDHGELTERHLSAEINV
jgi:putative ABC transport system ATP-binding protein